MAEIAERAERLIGTARDMARTEEEFRVRRTAASLRALAFRARGFLGAEEPVAAELREVFGLEWSEPAPEVERLHFRVDRALTGVAPLKVRVRRHYERAADASAAVETGLSHAFAACRELTFPDAPDRSPIPIGPVDIHWMTAADALTLPTGPAPFYGYDGEGRGTLRLPRGLRLGAPELQRLACHEAVPGHHLQAVVAERHFRETGWPELGIVPLYGPRTAVFEGLAATLERLVPLEPADETLRALEPVVARTLARYLDGDLSRLDAVRALDFEALAPDPHGLLDHADRFGAYALVRPSADPRFGAALETLLLPQLTPAERLERLIQVIREAMTPAEAITILSGGRAFP